METRDTEQDMINSDQRPDDRSALVPFDLYNPVIEINEDFEIERANDAAVPILEDWERDPGDVVPRAVYKKAEKAMTDAEPMEMETVLKEQTFILQIHPFPDWDTTVIQAVEVTDFLANDIRYRTLLQTCPDIFYQLDTDGYIQFINRNVSDFGYSSSGLIDQHITTIVHPDHEDLVRRHLVLAEEKVDPGQEKIKTDGLEIKLDIPGDGDRMFEARTERLYDREGHPKDRQMMGTVGVIREVTEKRRIKQELEEKEERLRTMAKNFDEVFWMFDKNFEELIYVNHKVEEIYGIAPERLEKDGRSFFDVIYPDHRPRVKEAIDRLRNGEKVELEYRVNRDEDFRRWVSVQGVPVFDEDGSVEKIIGSSREITQRKQYEQELEVARKKLKRQTYEDPLLKIPNRRLFSERYQDEWARARRESQPLSMLMVDIDYFKEYNDCYGHQQGDRCLKTIADIFQDVLERETDFVARYGGEEFVIILPNTDRTGAEELGEQLRQAVREQEIRHEESHISDYLTVSLGGATMVPDGSVNREAFLDVVDKQLYKAKESGRNQIVIERVSD